MPRTRRGIVGELTLSEANDFIENQLKLGSTPQSIANAMTFRADGDLIISKEFGETVNALKREDYERMLIEYIEDEFSYLIAIKGA